jgi:hypothetical protein
MIYHAQGLSRGIRPLLMNFRLAQRRLERKPSYAHLKCSLDAPHIGNILASRKGTRKSGHIAG